MISTGCTGASGGNGSNGLQVEALFRIRKMGLPPDDREEQGAGHAMHRCRKAHGRSAGGYDMAKSADHQRKKQISFWLQGNGRSCVCHVVRGVARKRAQSSSARPSEQGRRFLSKRPGLSLDAPATKSCRTAMRLNGSTALGVTDQEKENWHGHHKSRCIPDSSSVGPGPSGTFWLHVKRERSRLGESKQYTEDNLPRGLTLKFENRRVKYHHIC